MSIKKTPEVPPPERVQAFYKQLSVAAHGLNTASDELGKAISVWDAALQRLNLGVSAWVQLSGNESSSGWWWSRDVGYTKVGNRWGIALRKKAGDYQFPEDDSEEVWLFNEAPRWMRIETVGKIPDLLEALIKQAEDTAKKIKQKTAQALELAAAMGKVVEEAQSAEQKSEKPHE